MYHGTHIEARATGQGTPRPIRRARFSRLAAFAAVFGIGALLFGAACGDDDEPSADQLREVEDVARGIFEASGADVEFVLQHATDNLFESVFFASREECQAAAEECIGEPAAVESVTEVEIDGDEASAIVASDFGTFVMALVREDGVWRGDSLAPTSDEVPDGAAVVGLSLVDFAFNFDAGEIPSDGNFAFRVANEGGQPHEVVVISLEEGQEIEEAVGAIFAEEVAPLGLKAFIPAGAELDMAFEQPLAPGDYALVCFFPDVNDTEFTAHIDKGMVAEFSVQ